MWMISGDAQRQLVISAAIVRLSCCEAQHSQCGKYRFIILPSYHFVDGSGHAVVGAGEKGQTNLLLFFVIGLHLIYNLLFAVGARKRASDALPVGLCRMSASPKGGCSRRDAKSDSCKKEPKNHQIDANPNWRSNANSGQSRLGQPD